jgi:hypothetical protein
MSRPTVSVLFIGLALVAACGASVTPTATSTSPTLSPRLTASAPPGLSQTPATAPPSATALPRPAGWDATFCAAYTDIVVAQELARDIGRALDEDSKQDAIGLARELEATVVGVRTTLTALPAWPGGEQLLSAVNAMLDTDEELVTNYLRFLEENRDPALDRAHERETALREEIVPAVEVALAELAAAGFSCPGLNFTLDKP